MQRFGTLVGLFLSIVIVVGGCAAKKGGPCAARCAKNCKTPCTVDVEKWTSFGEPLKLRARNTVCVADVLSNPDRYEGKLIRVCGKVDSVCAHRGCWIRLAGTAGDETLFVKFTCPVEGRLVPMEAAGRCAVVEGTLEVKEISEEEARHYKEDAKAPPEEIAKIVGPQKLVNMRSPATIIDLVDTKGS